MISCSGEKGWKRNYARERGSLWLQHKLGGTGWKKGHRSRFGSGHEGKGALRAKETLQN